MGLGSLAQLVKCLMYKHEELSLDPQSLHKKPGRVVYTRNPSAGQVERGGSLEFTGKLILTNQCIQIQRQTLE